MSVKCQVPPTFKPHLLTTDAAITIVKVCLVERLFIVYAVISFLKWGQQGFEQLEQADGKTKSLPNDLSVRNKSSRRHKLISSLGIRNKEIIFKVLNSITKTRWMVVLQRRNLQLCFSCPTNTLHLSHSQILPSLQLKHGLTLKMHQKAATRNSATLLLVFVWIQIHINEQETGNLLPGRVLL